MDRYDIEVKGTDMGYDHVKSDTGSFYLVSEIEKQSKELEVLKEKNSKLTKLCSLLNYTAKEFEKESENYDEILELWPQVMLRSFELLKEKNES